MNTRLPISRLATVRNAHDAHPFRDIRGAGGGRPRGRFRAPLALVSGDTRKAAAGAGKPSDHPPASRRREGHRLAATGERETLRTQRPHHDRLNKRLGNLTVSPPPDDEVCPGPTARIISMNERLR